MSTMYKDLVNNYGSSQSIEEFAKKGQLVGAMNSKTIWEVWNYNSWTMEIAIVQGCYSGIIIVRYARYVPVCGIGRWSRRLHYIILRMHWKPLHAQFDYLKNTVSVCNDYYQSFKNYKVKADVYDLNSKKVFSYSQRIDIGEDEVLNDLFKN